jgi:hypothetical protein
MSLITYLKKRILRAVSDQEEPRFTDAQYKAFFGSPVWLAFRQVVAVRLDRAVDVVFTASETEAMHRMQGLVQGLAFVLAGEDTLAELIESEKTEEGRAALKQSKRTEEILKQLFELMENETMEDESHA